MSIDNLTSETQAALAYAAGRQEQHLAELLEFLRIPSVGTEPVHKADTEAAANWLAEAMRAAGLENVRLVATPRNPLVYGDWLHAGPEAPTVLVYGHYDVQPADPLDKWQTPPFEPTIKDNYIYARGASDDKGQVYIHVKSVAAYLQGAGRLPVNVKFIVEGEEESGGHSLAAFVPENEELLAAGVALISDTQILGPNQPALVYGLRGMCYVFLDITGPDHDLHSGSFGGGVDNPLNVLGHIVARLKEPDGRVLIPGFYDKVRPLTEQERRLLAEYPLDEAAWLRETGAPQSWGEPDYSLVERLGARPTLDVNGITGGYTGPGVKTVLPSTVHAKISMRLVPDQTPQEIFALFRDYVTAIAPPTVQVQCTFVHGGPASLIDYTIPAMKAAAAAYERVFGRKPVYMREGGSIPVVGLFQRYLGMQTVLMGFGLTDDRIHSPNERFYLPNYYRGIETAIHFLAEYAKRAMSAVG
ncbi:MAG: dipeptidase [Chloroflexi bacterium]|nr:dipeptidase [Chloroflexota bacterium]MCI0580016.1 dipeptidase [Chloroflexota bacterium]MCI0648459.1 dipeptidase [Chloroflexota bacterium]MCI0726640.1 dipeptidase [Chloroflexota bacterium]